jgi:hypothetical protein
MVFDLDEEAVGDAEVVGDADAVVYVDRLHQILDLLRRDLTCRLLLTLYTFSCVASMTFFGFWYRSIATLEGGAEAEAEAERVIERGMGRRVCAQARDRARWIPPVCTEFQRGYR